MAYDGEVMNNRRKLLVTLGAGALAFAAPPGSFGQQQGKVWRVGFLLPASASLSSSNTNAFLKGMWELGYVEGKNLVIEWRFADGKLERLPGLAAELGGNITGLSNMAGDIAAKFIDLLRSVVPKLSRVAMLTPSTSYGELSKSVQAAAQKAGVKTLVAEASTPQEIENAFSMMVREKADAVFVGSPTVFAQQHRQIAELALKYRMPSLFQDRVTVEAGGLMSYGQKFTDLYQRSATYVDKILKGAKPGDLPVEQPVSFELVVNLKTAKALGLTIPQSLLLRADEVIQ